MSMFFGEDISLESDTICKNCVPKTQYQQMIAIFEAKLRGLQAIVRTQELQIKALTEVKDAEEAVRKDRLTKNNQNLRVELKETKSKLERIEARLERWTNVRNHLDTIDDLSGSAARDMVKSLAQMIK